MCVGLEAVYDFTVDWFWPSDLTESDKERRL